MHNPSSHDRPRLVAIDGDRLRGEAPDPDRLWAEAVAARNRGDHDGEHALRAALHRVLRPLAHRIAAELGHDIARIHAAERSLQRQLDNWPISYSLWGFEEHLRQTITHSDADDDGQPEEQPRKAQ